MNDPREVRLNGQALAAFGTTRGNYCATASRFHARQKTVRASALDFGRLVCAFHDKSYWPDSYKASLSDSNDLGGRTTRPALQVRRTCNTPAADWLTDQNWIDKHGHAGEINPPRIGKPMIITDFSILATTEFSALRFRNCGIGKIVLLPT